MISYIFLIEKNVMYDVNIIIVYLCYFYYFSNLFSIFTLMVVRVETEKARLAFFNPIWFRRIKITINILHKINILITS